MRGSVLLPSLTLGQERFALWGHSDVDENIMVETNFFYVGGIFSNLEGVNDKIGQVCHQQPIITSMLWWYCGYDS